MLIKIRRIRNLGVLSDFSWSPQLPDFGRYNLIYGWNGSGKTTMSNFLAGLPLASVQGCPDLEYEVETTAGTVRTGEPLAMRTRVFNRDYVANNVHRVSGKASPIFVLGEENNRISEEIASDEMVLEERRVQVAQLEERVRGTARRKDKIFSQIAQTISQNTGGLSTRTYRKPNAERDLGALQGKALLDEAEVAASLAELRQQEKADVPELAAPLLRTEYGEKNLPDFLSALKVEGTKLCAQTVESRLIDRLARDADLAQWVERGLALHGAQASVTCEFCDQALPKSRMAVLAAHFNEADRKLKDDVDALLRRVEEAAGAVRWLQFPDKANLYDELQDSYQSAVDSFNAAKESLLSQLDTFNTSIAAKKGKTTEAVLPGKAAEAADFIARLEAANAEIKRHNAKTTNFGDPKEAARARLDAHYLSMISDDVKDAEKLIKDDELEIAKLKDGEAAGALGIAALAARIGANRAKISSAHKGCQEINDALKTFLGRDELQFEVDEDGYVLLRGQKPAENLSEGEKTAIGFVHFVIHLKDRDFDPTSGIVVVDDPISSLDSNSMFQAFAFLKNAVKDAKQVFLMTHNFDFLQLLLNWARYTKQSAHYMMKDSYGPSGIRAASLDILDRTLEGHESEYHYLFKRLYTFRCDGTIETAYPMPNIARKLLETFLMFRVPNNASFYKKLESLRPYFDENKLNAIYKFTNDQSHITGKGFDPALVPETEKNVKYLLQMTEAVFPEHYKILVDSLGHAVVSPMKATVPAAVEPASAPPAVN